MKPRLRDDLFAIWRAGVEGVDPERLIDETVQWDENTETLCIGDAEFPRRDFDRVLVLGAGKASGKMALALERRLLSFLDRERVLGWVNVPEDCLAPSEVVHLHGARPPGLNEPTAAGVDGSREIVRLIAESRPGDLCFCLLSGGGSALLPAPVPAVSLQEKIDLTRFLSGTGANIDELNTVRKQLSLLKGGGLKRLCTARNLPLVSLILSDVLGDPLDIIASGPTVDNPTTASDALSILNRYLGTRDDLFKNVRAYLNDQQRAADGKRTSNRAAKTPLCLNLIIGNNAVAVDAAGIEAEKRGYSHAMVSARESEGPAEEVGRHLGSMLLSMLSGGPDCLISGGEPTVRLVDPAIRGRGGRNQQLILAMLIDLLQTEHEKIDLRRPVRFAVLSGGTDGEDGPTDAAGAFLDEDVIRNVLNGTENPVDYLNRNDAYRYFEKFGGLLKTGPTGTNVCDLRVVVVDRSCG